MTPLIERLQTEADLCRNEGADDIARLLDEAVAGLRKADARVADERERCAKVCIEWARICDSGKRHGAMVGAQECAKLIRGQ